MSSRRHGLPYIWATWITGYLAGADHCLYAAWYKAHYKFDKVERDFDLAAWTAEHAAMVTIRASQLEAEGWLVAREDQNSFKLKGETALLAGKPDIIARRGLEVLVDDCKSSKQRDGDYFQILIYLFALLRVWAREPWFSRELRIRGELLYKTHMRTIELTELAPFHVARIIETIRQVAAEDPPAKVPSAGECSFCDLGPGDCPERIDRAVQPVLVSEF